MSQKRSSDIIRELAEQRAGWSDDEILAELAALPVLPDEEGPAWFGMSTSAWHEEETFELAHLFIALSDVVAQRRLRTGVPLLLERASYGDFGEMMRDLRHSLEAAYNPDWEALAEDCINMAKSQLRGARLWAVNELGVLRDPRALSTLIETLDDPASRVRDEAHSALKNLCEDYPEHRDKILVALERRTIEQSKILSDLQETMREIREMDGAGGT